MQIEIDNVEKPEGDWDDISDVIIASMPRDDEKITLAHVEGELRKEGKL